MFWVRIMLSNTIGKNIRKYRKNNHISQDVMAGQLNIRRQTLSAYERGESTPNIYMLMEISRMFHVSLDELVGNLGWEKKE